MKKLWEECERSGWNCIDARIWRCVGAHRSMKNGRRSQCTYSWHMFLIGVVDQWFIFCYIHRWIFRLASSAPSVPTSALIPDRQSMIQSVYTKKSMVVNKKVPCFSRARRDSGYGVSWGPIAWCGIHSKVFSCTAGELHRWWDDDCAIGFPVLILESAGTPFASPSTFIHAVLAVTTDGIRPNHYSVNDVLDNDV